MINTLALNSLTNLDEYNCGGFALCIEDWYSPDEYDEGQNMSDMLEDCANSIQKDFPELTRVSDYFDIPDELDVIGFRLSIGEEDDDEWDDERQQYVGTGELHEFVTDFHFILRSGGIWYHKPGGRPIKRVYFDIDGEWPHNGWNYNSDIVWFVRPHMDIEKFFIIDQGED